MVIDLSPVKCQFAQAQSGPWHDTMQANDKYRRDSLDGGTTWGTPYQFRGTDGKNGSPGIVDYTKVNQILKETYGITETFITGEKIGSPVIQRAQIYGCEIYAGGNGEKGGQILALTDRGIEIWNGYGDKIVTISEDANGYASICATGLMPLTAEGHNLALVGHETVWFSTAKVDFTQVQEVDFTDVKTRGLHFTLA